jgi:hypothetical protein
VATVDTTSLSSIITTCFSWSQDATLSDDQRSSYYNLGLHLREELIDAYTASFPDTDQRITSLNTQLSAIDTSLKNEADVLNSYAQNINQITSVLNVLDQLMMLVPK